MPALRNLTLSSIAALSIWPALPPVPSQPPAAAGCAAAPAVFGSAEKTAVSMEGKIYFLPKPDNVGLARLPDFAPAESHGSIYTDRWDIPGRSFTEGFPGVTDRFEWFALDYQGSIYVPTAGEYTFRSDSDDGSKLYLDGKVIVDNDGVHGMWGRSGTVNLTAGDHAFRLSYFQGPATQIGLQVYVTPPGGPEKIFQLQDFNQQVIDSRHLLGVTEDAQGIHVRFGAQLLFDTGKYTLRPEARQSLDELAGVMRSYPGRPAIIEGHTDNVGLATSNQVLSQHRADAVEAWLTGTAGIPAACLTATGFGASRPIASNTTVSGRQQNRRVEVRIEKPGG